ncbi:MAG: DUF58 domain-containing protein [Chitinophagales bacterium]|jgi:uncharacterized protein (DUF58 family)|nr:DUF58 domain-containing protein [Chitinophagales bacterium]
MNITQHTLADSLELIARQVVEGFIIGLHKSPFHGFSVEFAEHRLYNQGDALRHIDWKVYGRTDKLFVKKYEEETNLRCCLVVDTSASMHFATKDGSMRKIDFACLAAAGLIQLLKRQLDASALALFDSELKYLSECRSSHTHYRMLTHELEKQLKAEPKQTATNAAKALHEVAEQMHRRSLIVVFSDMMDDAEHADELFAALQHLKYNKHEVILFHIMEGSREVTFDFDNRPYEFVDMETGERLKLQPNQVKDVYINKMEAFRKEIENKCHQYHIDMVPVDLSQPVEQVLYSFLLKRNKML